MATLLEELLQPISESSFCGEDGSYEPEYEAAKAEAEKITENNFGLMADQSRKFLVKKSKDMRVLGFLAVGTGLSADLTSFAHAVTAYCKLATEHWEDIHPKRPAARSNALKWLNQERNVGLLSAVNGRGDYEALSLAYEELIKLQKFCDDKFPEGPPTFMGFIKVVKEYAEKNKPKAEPAPGEVQAVASSASSAPPPPQEIASADDAFMAIQKAAYFLLEQDRANALAYRLIRIQKWGGVSGAVPSNNGQTMIPAPYPHVFDGLKEMVASQRWPDVATFTEEAFSGDSGVFWLDLQRYQCTAMQAMGGGYLECAKTIKVELAMMLQRSPEIPNLTFDDGTPFADSMTKEWVQTDVMSSLGGGGGGMAMAAVKKKGDVGEEQKAAEALLGENKLDQALHALRTGLANDSSEKNNFDRRFIMAELCYKGNKPVIARALLEDLLALAERYELAKWDPDLCVSVYHLSQKVYLALAEAGDDQGRNKALAMHTQISKLNPVLAISTEIK